jgi:heat shock protein HtpX
MEMCIDNPRQGFGELFDTHPTVESRVAALVKFAGGHDRGPLALPPADEGSEGTRSELPAPGGPWESPLPRGPWDSTAGTNVEGGAGASPPPGGTNTSSEPGPWGPHRGR